MSLIYLQLWEGVEKGMISFPIAVDILEKGDSFRGEWDTTETSTFRGWVFSVMKSPC